MHYLNSILTFKSAFVLASFILPMVCFLLYKKLFSLLLKPNSLKYKRLIAFIELKYILIYIAHSYVLFLWLYAVGNDKNLIQRFKIIYGCSVILYLCSIFYRFGIVFFSSSILLKPWVLFSCIFIFGINAFFRISLHLGILGYCIVIMTESENSNKPKKSNIQLKAESFDLESKLSAFSFSYHSIGQICVLQSIGQLSVFGESYTELTKHTLPIENNYNNYSLYCVLFVAFIIFLYN